MAAKTVQIGLIGAGRIGRLHGNNISASIPEANLAAVADSFLNDDIKAWAASKGVRLVTDKPEELLADPGIEAILICSSTPTHADYIIKAAEAGKHIFCEKPLDTRPEVIKKALEAVKKAGVKLQVGFVRRFDHNHKKVHDTVASGFLGRPHLVKITSRDPEIQPFEYMADSGGIFMDMTIHDFDMARYLCGSEVTEVMAYGALLIEPRLEQYGDVDTAIVTLKFENGALGVIENSRAAHYGYDQRTEVHCDKGCVQAANDLNDTAMISTADGVFCAKPTWFFLERYNNAFIAEISDFANAVLTGRETPLTGHDGLMPVYIALAAEKSRKEGRPVKLAEVM